MAGFEDLAKVILGKDHGVFLVGGVQGRIANIEKIGPQGEMRTMLFQNAEGQQARALRLLDRQAEIACSQFLPMS